MEAYEYIIENQIRLAANMTEALGREFRFDQILNFTSEFSPWPPCLLAIIGQGQCSPLAAGPTGAPEPRGLDGANVMWEGLGACRGPRGHFALASAPDTFLLASRPQKCPYMMREDAHHAVYQPCVGLPT